MKTLVLQYDNMQTIKLPVPASYQVENILREKKNAFHEVINEKYEVSAIFSREGLRTAHIEE